jgi:hypothetical protein
MRPGNRAAAKSWPTETGSGVKLPLASWAVMLAPASMSASRMSTMEGGMIWPSVPEAQMMPVASLGS